MMFYLVIKLNFLNYTWLKCQVCPPPVDILQVPLTSVLTGVLPAPFVVSVTEPLASVTSSIVSFTNFVFISLFYFV